MAKHRFVVVALSVVVMTAAGASLLLRGTNTPTAEAMSAAEIADGRVLYVEYCASCHGETLEGEPDWRTRREDGRLPAPPHDASGHTWHHSDEALDRIVREGTAAVVGGGYESDMPGFGSVLSDAEISAVLGYIKSTWPDRERRVQEQASR